jgi:hypothetical protein
MCVNFLPCLLIIRQALPITTNTFIEKGSSQQSNSLIVYTGVPKKEDESITPLFIGRF